MPSFAELRKTFSFGFAVALQYEALQGNEDFWKSLTRLNWQSIYEEEKTPPELKERAFLAVKRLAENSDKDLSIIINSLHPNDSLTKWAKERQQQLIAQKSEKSFEECLDLACAGKCELDELLKSAKTLIDLVIFCNFVHNRAIIKQAFIQEAIQKIAAIDGLECKDWIRANERSHVREVKQAILLKIKAFKLPLKDWLLLLAEFCNNSAQAILKEMAIACIADFSDCKRLIGISRFYDERERLILLGMSFANSFDEFGYLSSFLTGNSNPETRTKLAEGLAKFAGKDLERWKRVYYVAPSESSLRQEAFEEMKNLANAPA
jgi:hypothetical protein